MTVSYWQELLEHGTAQLLNIEQQKYFLTTKNKITFVVSTIIKKALVTMATIGKELKMKSFKSSYQKATLNIMFTGNWIMAQTEAMLKPFGISQQQYNVLRILRGQSGEAVNLFTIQQRMLSRMSNATRLVEKLRQKGLVERQLCEANRRKVEITITEKGLELLDKIDPLLEKIEEKHFKGISAEEAEKMSNWLDKIRS